MGGEGTMSAANQSLKNNRALLRKERYGRWTKMGTIKKTNTSTQTKKTKELTEEERKLIRTRIRRENLRTNLKIWITLILIVGILLLVFFWIKK